MNRQGVARWTGWVFALAGVVIGVGVFTVAPRAQTAPAPEDVAAGFRIYRQKADCQACHGWAADGRKMESQMPDGANLRATKLDRAKLVQAIKCGIPGKAMPAFDKFAYSDGRCYGMKQADLAEARDDDAGSCGDAAGARDRAGGRLPLCESRRQGPDESRGMRRVLGL